MSDQIFDERYQPGVESYEQQLSIGRAIGAAIVDRVDKHRTLYGPGYVTRTSTEAAMAAVQQDNPVQRGIVEGMLGPVEAAQLLQQVADGKIAVNGFLNSALTPPRSEIDWSGLNIV